MTASLAHICAFPVHPLNAAAWLGTIAPGNFAGSRKTWQKYKWLQRQQMTNKFLKQVKNRHQDYPVKVLAHLYGCHGLTLVGRSAPPR